MSFTPTESPESRHLPMEDISPTSTFQELESPVGKQHRKSVSTGGGRAWSQEEVSKLSLQTLSNLTGLQENYLIETRMHKTPYKHIATTLKKTELACRLHYHQLSFGTKRRRRNSSVTSIPSYAPSPITPSEAPKRHFPQQALPPLSSLASPESPERNNLNLNRSPQTHIPILPRPVPSSRPAPPSSRGLRLITEDIDQYGKKPMVDIARLDKIYDAHRLHFWSTIARSYGCNLSPAALEQAWCKAHHIDASNLPPTPTASPDENSKTALGAPFSAVAEYSRGFTAVNSAVVPRSAVVAPTARKVSFAISSLLTEDKEVRSPGQEKTREDCAMV
ncbi:MAG: hypothetical protein L6R39_002338 [Caloplaca ligustica]|nr:MAG: hypothetical protein L6R39_002338 [Caloplaca ligustica]